MARTDRAREQRLAAALRANLRRRKAQARTKDGEAPAASGQEGAKPPPTSGAGGAEADGPDTK